jgi:hypothetical protein
VVGVTVRVYLLWCGEEQLDKGGVGFVLEVLCFERSFNRKDGAPNFKGKGQLQGQRPTSKAKSKFKGEGQLQRRRASGGLLGGALALLGDFCEFAGFYVVDEAAYGDVLDIGVVPDAGDLAADVLLGVFEGVEMGWADG